jgi:hypothetical protein
MAHRLDPDLHNSHLGPLLLKKEKRKMIERVFGSWAAGTVAGVLAMTGSLGCATTASLPGLGETDCSSAGHRGAPSVRAGHARVIGSQVNPLGSLHMATDGSEVDIAFARPGRASAVARLDAASLEPQSPEQAIPLEDPAMFTEHGPARVVLRDGQFVLCWVRGDDESGHRALVQAFNANGSPRGAPVVISPEDFDVVGAPRAITTDGRHVVVTFVGARDRCFEVLAVPVDDASSVAPTEAVAANAAMTTK